MQHPAAITAAAAAHPSDPNRPAASATVATLSPSHKKADFRRHGPGSMPVGGRGGGGGAGVERGVPGNNVADAAPASGARVAAAAAAPPPPPDAESQAVVSALNGMLGALSETPLSPSEKKMLGDVTKAVSVLFAKMGHGQVERATLDKVGQLVKSLETRDMKAANAIQQGLANSVWQSHKDWLKGLKYLMTLVSRRL